MLYKQNSLYGSGTRHMIFEYVLVNGMWIMTLNFSPTKNETFPWSTSIQSSMPERCITTSLFSDWTGLSTPDRALTFHQPAYRIPGTISRDQDAGQRAGVKTLGATTENIRTYWRKWMYRFYLMEYANRSCNKPGSAMTSNFIQASFVPVVKREKMLARWVKL